MEEQRFEGLYYESARKRWRVRIYRGSKVVFLRYHKDYTLALADWKKARRENPPAQKTPISKEAMIIAKWLLSPRIK